MDLGLGIYIITNRGAVWRVIPQACTSPSFVVNVTCARGVSCKNAGANNLLQGALAVTRIFKDIKMSFPLFLCCTLRVSFQRLINISSKSTLHGLLMFFGFSSDKVYQIADKEVPHLALWRPACPPIFAAGKAFSLLFSSFCCD